MEDYKIKLDLKETIAHLNCLIEEAREKNIKVEITRKDPVHYDKFFIQLLKLGMYKWIN